MFEMHLCSGRPSRSANASRSFGRLRWLSLETRTGTSCFAGQSAVQHRATIEYIFNGCCKMLGLRLNFRLK